MNSLSLFWGHMIEELNRRISSRQNDIYLPWRQVCQKIVDLGTDVINSIADNLYNIYSVDLICNSEELSFNDGKKKRENLNKRSRPQTILSSLNACNRDYYPNVFILLQILSILPVSSAENERAFSAIGRLKTYLRTTVE